MAVSTAHVLSLQQECLQLDRLKTQLSDAVQRYGGVQKVRLPGGAGGPAGVGLGPWSSRSGRLAPGLAWWGPVPGSRGQAWPRTADGRQELQPRGVCSDDFTCGCCPGGPWRVGRVGAPVLTVEDPETWGFRVGRGPSCRAPSPPEPRDNSILPPSGRWAQLPGLGTTSCLSDHFSPPHLSVGPVSLYPPTENCGEVPSPASHGTAGRQTAGRCRVITVVRGS